MESTIKILLHTGTNPKLNAVAELRTGMAGFRRKAKPMGRRRIVLCHDDTLEI